MCIEEQYALEEAFSKQGLLKLLKKELEKDLFYNIRATLVSKINGYLHAEYWESKEDVITAICMQDIDVAEIADSIILLAMKHAETSIQNVAVAVGNLFDLDDPFIKVQLGSDLLYACKGVVYNLVRLEEGILFDSFIQLSDNVKSQVSLHMYLPPLVIKPLKIRNNYQSGYLTKNDSVILGSKESDHNKPVRLDVINILNQIGFVIDPDVAKEEEVSKSELIGQDLDNWKQYLVEKKAIKRIYKDKTFWFNWKLDSRGRIYSQGYHLNPQSSEYQKALISLSKFEEVK